MIGGVVLYFSATAKRIVAKGSITVENIVVKSSDHRHCGVFVHYGAAIAEEIVTKRSDLDFQ